VLVIDSGPVGRIFSSSIFQFTAGRPPLWMADAILSGWLAGRPAGWPLPGYSRVMGSTARPLSQVSKCAWHPVEFPVVPE